jgi:hypothetical protein
MQDFLVCFYVYHQYQRGATLLSIGGMSMITEEEKLLPHFLN